MYGLVNEAVKQMVVDSFGVEKWNEVCTELNLEEPNFMPFEQYEDSLTGDLVGKICEKFSFEAPVLLEEFGKYWVTYARNSEYSSILNSFATSPIDLIKSLDSLHTRLELTFDELRPPSFWVTEKDDKKIWVHYQSHRDMPLEFFVIGLIKGIFLMFDQECSVSIIPSENGEKAVFEVTH
jgi:hypothetical protein